MKQHEVPDRSIPGDADHHLPNAALRRLMQSEPKNNRRIVHRRRLVRLLAGRLLCGWAAWLAILPSAWGQSDPFLLSSPPPSQQQSPGNSDLYRTPMVPSQVTPTGSASTPPSTRTAQVPPSYAGPLPTPYPNSAPALPAPYGAAPPAPYGAAPPAPYGAAPPAPYGAAPPAPYGAAPPAPYGAAPPAPYGAAPPGYPVPSPWSSASGAFPPGPVAGPAGEPVMPSVGSTLGQPMQFQTPLADGPVSPTTGFRPRVRNAPIDVYVQEAQTGRMVFGGSVNTDLGVAGQVIIEERNFDLLRFPRSFQDLFNGAFRGNGENFRMELMPGNRVQRYSVNWTQPNLFGYSPWSLSVSGFLFDRIYQDWDENRLGGRVMLGYQITPDLSFSTEVRGENVDISDPRITGVEALDSVVGDHELWTGRFRLAHNTRDSPFLPTEGHFLELIYDQVFGNFDFPRGQINYSKYFLIRERADGGGRHTLTSSWRFGFSGEETPIFENFFAGGFTTLRGFSFRGASPVESGVQVGGRFMFLGTLEYMFPITADDMLRMVTFVDYGTIERDIEVNSENFRVAPGLGFRIAVPALGPGPLAFDFAFPVSYSDSDDRQVFSFNVGVTR
ncbi:MAG: outer membrane protein assembly factor [Pirellulaceae bacterium]